MLRRLLPAVLVALTAAGALPGVGAAAGPRHRVCGPAKARTLAASPQARVFVLYDGDHDHLVPYACGRGGERRRALAHYYERECYGSSSGCGGLGQYRVAGRFVAYEDYDCCGASETAYFTIHVLDARRMRLRLRKGFTGLLERLVLRADGATAWSSTARHGDGVARGQVRRFPSCGGESLVASGPEVEPATLRRQGDGIAWLAGGAEHTAPLC